TKHNRIVWMSKRVDPIGPGQVQSQARLKKQFTLKRLDTPFQYLWISRLFQFSARLGQDVDMFNIIKTSARGEMIRERHLSWSNCLAKCATNMPINGCRRRHAKRWLDTMHKVGTAKGGCHSIRHNLQDLHVAAPPS